MVFYCRGKDCGKSFSTTTNRNKHEKSKGHWSKKKSIIEFDSDISLFVCPSAGCNTTSKYKCNIKKHLESCHAINKQKDSVANNKICPDCGKEFIKKSNRDRHFKQFHSEKVEEHAVLPTMVDIPNEAVLTIDDAEPLNDMPQSPNDVLDTSDVVDNVDVVDTIDVASTNDVTDSMEEHPNVVGSSYELLNTTVKRSWLESVISKITRNIDHSFTLNQRIIEKLKLDLKNNKNEATSYMQCCFGEILDDESFLTWFSSAAGYKPNRLKRILSDKQPNRRNSAKLPPSCHQEIYKFWLEKSITSTDSTNNLKRITKKAFLQKYIDIVDTNLREEVVQLKIGIKVRYTAIKMIYVESIRKLHNEFSSKHVPVSLTTFFNFKPFYCIVPSEKEKQSCVRINCQNPHLLLQAINRYHAHMNR